MGYVGWQVCRDCHPLRVDEFQTSRHFLALQLPQDAKFPPGFQAGANEFLPPNSPARFTAMLSPQPTITATPVEPSSEGPTESPIAFVYGSGAGTDEVYFTRKGDKLFELPAVWLSPRSCWGASLFDPYGSGDFSRPLTPQCLECHTVWVDYHRGTLNEYGPFDPQLLGASCERCHGPGNSHVEYHRGHPDDKTPAHIVQPKTLSRERLMDLCAQCHTNTVRHRRPPFSYRPGEPLDESFLVLEMQSPEQDRVANQVRYLKESRCYQQSDHLTCVTCHDPHHAKSDDPRTSHQTCLTCHQPESCEARPRLPESLRDQCATCHMPLRNKVQVNFETADGELVFPAPLYKHKIGVYPEMEWEALFEWYGRQSGLEATTERSRLAERLQKHWTAAGHAAAEDQRFLIAIDSYRQALRFTDEDQIKELLADVLSRKKSVDRNWSDGQHLKREKRFEEAIDRFQALLAIKPDDAGAHYEIGTMYAAIGRPLEGVQELRIACRLDPNDPSPHVMLGWLDFLAGKPVEALKNYLQAEQIEPWSDRIVHMVARCQEQLGDWDAAVDSYLKVLTINPRQVEAGAALRKLLRERFSATEALPKITEAVRASAGKQAELLLTLAEIDRELDRIPEAEEAIRAARAAASAEDANLLAQIIQFEKSLESRRKAGQR